MLRIAVDVIVVCTFNSWEQMVPKFVVYAQFYEVDVLVTFFKGA